MTFQVFLSKVEVATLIPMVTCHAINVPLSTCFKAQSSIPRLAVNTLITVVVTYFHTSGVIEILLEKKLEGGRIYLDLQFLVNSIHHVGRYD